MTADRRTAAGDDPLAVLAALDGVPSAVAAARDAVDAVLRDRGLRRISAEQRAWSLLDGARANVALASSDPTIPKPASPTVPKPASPAEQPAAPAEQPAEPDRLLPGAIRLAGELPELAGTILRSPGQALARAHTLLAHGLLPEESLGRIRPSAADRMTGLQRLLTTPTAAPGLVLAAIAHAEVATVAPFGYGDGLVARAIEQAVLIARGVDPEGVLPVCSGHRDLAEVYGERLAGYAAVSGVGPWIVHCTRAVTNAAELLGAELSRPAGRRTGT